jgi:hypothetical protein
MAATDQPGIRDGMVGRATRAGRDQHRAIAGKAGDAVDARGRKGFGQGHRRQDGREPAGRPYGVHVFKSIGRSTVAGPANTPLRTSLGV